MAIIGYARVSSTGQKLDVQIEALEAAGCDRIYKEKLSGAITDRPELEKMIDYAREGDTIIVTKLDRLARSMRDFCNIVADLDKFGVGLKILSIEGLDTSNPTGKMILGVLASIAEFERELIRERQQDGIEKAKKEGRYKGRKPLSRDVRRQVYELLDDGCTKAEIARELGIGRSSVYNFIAQRKKDAA